MITLYIFLYFFIGFIYGCFYRAFIGDTPSLGEFFLYPVFILVRIMKYAIIAIIFVIKEIIFGFKELGKIIID